MEKYSFFNSVGGDRAYNADDWANYFRKFITTGIFPSPSTNLQVIADFNDMLIGIRPGAAWINGYMYENTDDLSLAIDVADGVLNRIDRVVVQLSFIERVIKTVVKKGTAASSPVPPAVQRDADIYELGIATISVPAGATSITQTNVTDTRNDVTVGGIVNNLFADANAQARNVMLDDLNNYFVSDNAEGALIELKQDLRVTKSGEDANGQFTIVTWKNTAGVTVKKSVLSNPDVDGNYLTRTFTLYDEDGTTPMKETIFTLVYNADGIVIDEVPS